jgi:folate-binding protein YgfZ
VNDVSLTLPGAVPADAPDGAVAGHLGDPAREQRLLETGAAVDRSHRGVLAVRGPDRLSWLHALTTQDVAHLAPGAVTELLVLSPHGHVEHHADVLEDGETTWLLTEPGAAAPLAAFLDGMRFMQRVEVVEQSSRLATVTVTGGLSVPGALVVRAGTLGDDVLVERSALAAALAGLPVAGHDAWEARRVAAGQARAGVDTDHKTLVHEVGWLAPAVALDKGCYRGQETVARVHNLGRPPRRLVALHLDGSGHLLPARGTEVLAGDRVVGTLTSVARHHELGPIGLALLRRSVPDEAVLVTADGVAAAFDRDLSSPTQPVDLSGVRGR